MASKIIKGSLSIIVGVVMILLAYFSSGFSLTVEGVGDIWQSIVIFVGSLGAIAITVGIFEMAKR